MTNPSLTSTNLPALKLTKTCVRGGSGALVALQTLMELFGSLGGYLWDYGNDVKGVFVNFHLYTSAELQFKAGYSTITLRQKTDWPREGKADFK